MFVFACLLRKCVVFRFIVLDAYRMTNQVTLPATRLDGTLKRFKHSSFVFVFLTLNSSDAASSYFRSSLRFFVAEGSSFQFVFEGPATANTEQLRPLLFRRLGEVFSDPCL